MSDSVNLSGGYGSLSLDGHLTSTSRQRKRGFRIFCEVFLLLLLFSQLGLGPAVVDLYVFILNNKNIFVGLKMLITCYNNSPFRYVEFNYCQN